jgi:hypothetical protein
MRYLKLFEAFEAQALSKVIKFLTKKVGKNSSNDFKNKLKNIMNIYDIPLDKIKESNVKYLSKKQAIKIDSTKDVDNRFGIYCIKFWFSLENGYIGYTGVGNTKIDFEEWKQRYHSSRSSSEQNGPFNGRELEYIKTELGLTTGLLIPIDGVQFRYDDLQLGDEVVAIWNESESYIDKLSLAKIWRENGGDYLWAIQDVSSGGGVNRERLDFNGEVVHYTDWGRYSWSLDDVDSPGSDHKKLHRYIRNDEPISVQGQEKEEETKKETSIYDFNLPISRSGSLDSWGNNSSINSYEVMDDSDFSIVFYIGDMLDPDKSEFYETPKDIKTQRIESRKGATKLISDVEIKKINIKRYLQASVAKMGIKKDISELQNLQNIIKNATCGEFALFSLYTDYPSLDFINDFSKQVTNLLRETNDEDKEYYIDRISNIYKNSTDSKSGAAERYKQAMDIISKCDDEETKKFIGELMKISKYIQSYFESQNIQTIEDLRMVFYKLRSIRSLILDDEFKFINYRDIITEIFYPSDVKRACERLKSKRENGGRVINDELEDYKRLKNIEKYIKSVLI